MEKHLTAQKIHNDVNNMLLNHFLYGWDVTDKEMSKYFRTYKDDEWNYFCYLWNKRVILFTKGLQGLN
jgi:hypothetical protein